MAFDHQNYFLFFVMKMDQNQEVLNNEYVFIKNIFLKLECHFVLWAQEYFLSLCKDKIIILMNLFLRKIL